LENLTPNTHYFIRSYFTTEYETIYGTETSFTTLELSEPTVSTIAIDNITVNSAQSGGNVTDDGGLTVTTCGVVWNATGNPTLEDNEGKTSDGSGTGNFTSELTGLQDGTTYYVRAWATNEHGTRYGDEVEFTTLEITIPTADFTGAKPAPAPARAMARLNP